MAEDREITVARANRAAQLLDDDLLKGAFESLEQSYIAAWRQTNIEDVSAREKLFLAINIVGKVRSHLQTVLDDGKLAATELRNLAQTAERQRGWHEIP